MKFKTLLIVLFVVLLVLFSAQNSFDTNIDFLFWQFPVPLVVIILISFLIGIIVGLFFIRQTSTDKSNKEKIE